VVECFRLSVYQLQVTLQHFPLFSPVHLRTVVADTEQLLRWRADIVAAVRKNGYLASTANAIAIYQTSMLLPGMRNRTHLTLSTDWLSTAASDGLGSYSAATIACIK
jgi:hypothetical protein